MSDKRQQRIDRCKFYVVFDKNGDWIGHPEIAILTSAEANAVKADCNRELPEQAPHTVEIFVRKVRR